MNKFAIVMVLSGVLLAGCDSGQNTKQVSVEEAPSSTANQPDLPKPVWSKEDAKTNSKATFDLIMRAQKDLNTAVETGDRAGFVQYVTRPLWGNVDEWNKHDYPAEFEPCRSAAMNLRSFAMTMYNQYLSEKMADGIQNRKDRAFYEGQFKEDLAACKKITRS